jgi:hypothetical protein
MTPGFTRKRAVGLLSDTAFRLLVTAADYVATENTGGAITPAELDLLPRCPFGEQRAAALLELVSADLWAPLEGGGWSLVDLLPSKPVPASKQAPEAKAELASKRAEAGRRGGLRSAEARRTVFGSAQPKQTAEANAEATSVVSPTTPSDPEEPQKQDTENHSDLPEKLVSAGARERTRKCRMPEPFDVTPEHLAHAEAKGWPEWWLRDRHEQFRNLAKAKGWLYLEWNLALYTFLRNEITYGRGPEAMAALRANGGRPGFARGPVQQNHGKTGTENVRRL